MTKRALALLLVIAMVFSLLPVTMVSAEGEGYSLTLQKAHNQTEGELAIDVYLQANTAGQGDVTGYQFTVTPGNGAQLTGAVDQIATENIYSGEDATTADVTDYNVIYNPAGENAVAVAVGTSRTLLATLTLNVDHTTFTGSLSTALGLSGIKVTLGTTGFYADVAPAEDDADYASYLGAVTQSEVGYACTDHTCGHGTGEWTPVTTADLSGATLASGNYYLVEDIDATARTQITAENAQVNICLNGYTWTCSKNQMILIKAAGATVNICDCTATGSGTDLVAGKIVPQVYNWGSLRVDGVNTTLNVSNVIVEGAENAEAYNTDNANIGNAATFYTPYAAVGSVIHVEDVLIRNVHAKTVVDTRAGGYFKNVVFQNCSGSLNDPTDEESNMLAIFAANGSHKDTDGAYLTIEDCKFIDCDSRVLDTEGEDLTYTLKGNVQADGEFFVEESDNLVLELGEEAHVRIQTEELKSSETMGEALTVPETATVTANTLFYANANDEVITYKDGVFSVNSHVHEDGYADVDSTTWKPWYDATSLPTTAGNWYLATDVTLPSDADTYVASGSSWVNICLNGHTVDASAAKRVYHVYSHTVRFCDCKGHADPDKAGTLIGGTATMGSVFTMRGKSGTLRGGYLYLYDIKMTSSDTDTTRSAIYIEATNENNTTSKSAILYMDGVEAYNFHAYEGSVVRLQSTNDTDTIDYSNTSTVTIKNCDFHDNTATNRAPVLCLLEKPTVTIENTKFYNNTAAKSGGAVLVSTADSTDTPNVTITGCEFTNNTAGNDGSGYGGALYSSGDSVVVTVTDSTFTGNAADAGGAIYTSGLGDTTCPGNTLTLNNCKITDNRTLGTGSGGGVYITKADCNVILSGNTVIAGNTMNGTADYNTDLFYQANNTWTQPLMQVNNLGSGAHINACYLSETAAVNVLASTTDAETGEVTVTEDENDASELVAVAEGGTQDTFCGLISYAKDTSGVKTVSYLDMTADETVNPTFVYGHYHYNATTKSYDELKAWTETTSLPSANPTDTVSAEDTTLRYAGYYLANNVDVSAAVALAANTELCLCTNGRTVNGGSTQAYRILSADTGAELTMEDCTATYDEDGYFISGGKFDGFSKGGNGIVLQFYTGTVNISGIEFTNNVDTSYLYKDCTNATRGYGGGVIQTRSSNSLTLNIDGCKFANNSSGSDGGAIVSQAGQIQISNTVFEGNVAHRSGGAIMMAGASSRTPKLDLTNCKFEDNHTYGTPTAADATTTLANTARGGAVYAIYTAVDITDCEFIGNTAGCGEGMTTNDSVGRGGAVYVWYSGADNAGLTMTNTTFQNNTAEYDGGAVYAHNISVTTTNCTADGNSADRGAVSYMNASTSWTDTNGKYTYNTAGTGGTFVVSGADLSMNGTTIEYNEADHGGALTLWGDSNTVLHDTTVQYNKTKNTKDNYGGVFFGGTGYADACVLTVSGVTVIDNNTNANGTVERNIVIRENVSPIMQIGEGGLEAGSSIGVASRGLNKGYYRITGDLGDAADPAQYFVSDNSNYAIAKVNGKLPTYTATGTAKPTTHADGIAAEAAVAAAQAKVESGEYYEIRTAKSAEIAAEGDYAATTYTYMTGYVADSDTAVDHLAFVAAKIGDQYYHTAQSAVTTAAGTEATVTLLADADTLTASGNLTIDLDGNDIQKLTMADGTTLSLIDSKTNDYDVADGDYGKAVVEGGTVEQYVGYTTSAGKLRRYLVLTDDDGAYSAHRIYLAINAKVLRTANNGVGFKAIYGGDQVVKTAIDAGTVQYGMLLTLDNTADKNTWLYGDFSATGFAAGPYTTSTPNQKTAVVMNVLSEDAEDNQANAEATIYGVPCIAVNNTVVTCGTEISTSLIDLASDAMTNGTEEVKAAVEAMVEDFGITLN